MSVKAALYKYLTDQSDLPGLPARPFERPRIISGTSIRNRNDARRLLRDKIGDAIHISRRPRDSKHTALVLRTLDEECFYGLAGVAEGASEQLTITVYGKGGDAPLRVETASSLVALALSGYYGALWGSTYVGECLLQSKSNRETPPADASDDWTFETFLDFSILYHDEGIPVYPVDLLQAAITVGLLPQESDEFRLSAMNSIVPAGQTLVSVTWTIRADSAGGDLIVTFGGAAHAPVDDEPDIGGTNAEPALDRAAYELDTPRIVYVSLTITDSSGETSTIGGLINV